MEHREHAVLDEGRRLLISDPARFDGVTAIGVDEHVWRHTRLGDKYVTVMIDMTAVRAGTGPARLLDMVQGRTEQVFATWLAARPQAWRDRVQVVAMDGFTGFKTAATEQLPDAVTVLDPFHVVRVRHEALCVRAEVRGLRRPPVAEVGRDAVLANLIHGEATPVVVANVVPGQPGEDLRLTRGDAAGGELGAVPVDRHAVNMGTVPVPPGRPTASAVVGRLIVS